MPLFINHCPARCRAAWIKDITSTYYEDKMALYPTPETEEEREEMRELHGPDKGHKSVQTYFKTDHMCPLCDRIEYIRTLGKINLTKPSLVDPAACNEFTREAAVECPDTTYYESSQLVFVVMGGILYRGWEYVGPDGQVGHMPKYPVGVRIDEIRVDPPLRNVAPM